MALRLIRWFLIVSVVVFVLVNPAAIYSCGPYMEEAVFVQSTEPQVSQEDFATGKLGIVLPTMRQSYLIVAYRYLSGLPLESKYRQDAMDVWNHKVGSNPDIPENDGTKTWKEARIKISGLQTVSGYDVYSPVSPDQPYQTYLNCSRDAFNTAAATLAARIEKYSADSVAVREWVSAQDQVFKNCDGKAQVVPAVLDSKDSLLRADRNYQIAAAQFYSRKFDDALSSFDAIAKDPASPWAGISSYLAARALVRKSNLSSTDYNKFDVEMMKAAQQRLEQTLADPKLASMHAPAQRLLDYVRFRTEPTKRVAELEKVMLQPDPGPEFLHHFWDYTLLLSRGEHGEDLGDWVQTVYVDWGGVNAAPVQSKEAVQHAVEKWHELHSLPWLVAALQLTPPDDKNASDLLAAANAVPANSMGYLTVRYYALRLMAVTKPDEARKELDATLARPEGELAPGTRNLFNDERQKLLTSLPDFLAHAAEVPSFVGYDNGNFEYGAPISTQLSKRADTAFFNAYSAKVLSRYMPIALLLEAAQSSSVPNPLRRDLARSTWTRAVLIGDLATANKLQPVLEQLDHPLWKTMEPFRSASNDSDKHFTGVFVILNNPGLRPSVRAGVLRSATLGEIDNYRDNWWCGEPAERATEPPLPSFLSPADLSNAKQEREKLTASESAPNYLTSEVLTYATQHPENPLVPQALHLSVRATRYGCANPETTHLSEKAFQLLHQRYPDDEWTKKTKYHF